MRALSVLLMLLMAWLPLAQAGSWCCTGAAQSQGSVAAQPEIMPCHPDAQDAAPPTVDPQACQDHCKAMASQIAATPQDEPWKAPIRPAVRGSEASPQLRTAHARPLLRPPATPLH